MRLSGGTVRVCRGTLPGRRDDVLARLLLDELGERLGLRAGDDVLRHRTRGEAAVANRVEHAVLGLLTLIEARTVLVLARPHVGRGAFGAGDAQRVAPRAALDEQLGGGPLVLGDRYALLAAGGDDTRGGGEQRCGQQRTAGPRHRVRQHRGEMPWTRTTLAVAVIAL